MKLEIRHLCSYLPYGLKARHMPLQNEYFDEEITVLNSYGGVLFKGELEGATPLYCYDYKPILHPLSDLVKPITVNGETFVPLVELFILNFPKNIDIPNALKGGECFIEDSSINFKSEGFLFGYDLLDSSFCLVLDGETLTTSNQLELFQKLFEWHMDVFNQIPAGNAIDINTIL